MAADLSIQAKLLIPEEWANRSRCPVCGSVYLSLKRSYKDPDQLACDTCKARFEISQDGCYVRVIIPPPGLPMDLVGQWVEPSLVAAKGKAAVAQAKVLVDADQARRGLAEKPVSREALIEQARQLQLLGNSHEQVRSTLEGMRGVTTELISEVMEALPRQENRRSKWFWAGLGTISLLVISIAVVIGLGLAQRLPESPEKQRIARSGTRFADVRE